MARLSGESSREAVGGCESYKLAPFLTKVYHLVEDPAVNDLISWNDDGTSFVVWQWVEFSRDLLPKYFRHNNFSSFVKQLNIYGFRKIAYDRWEYSNDCFKRGEKALLRNIQRQKISGPASTGGATSSPEAVTVAVSLAAQPVSPANFGDEQVLSPNSSPVITNLHRSSTSLVEENDRLGRENAQLRLELRRLRGMCDSAMALMKNYNFDSGGAAESREGEREEGEMSIRLFGVSIGVKRLRLNDDVEGRAM